ncbi:hypothetical protein D3C78_853560 [compost metagenome]
MNDPIEVFSDNRNVISKSPHAASAYSELRAKKGLANIVHFDNDSVCIRHNDAVILGVDHHLIENLKLCIMSTQQILTLKRINNTAQERQKIRI